jgi:hypothetical protein
MNRETGGGLLWESRDARALVSSSKWCRSRLELIRRRGPEVRKLASRDEKSLTVRRHQSQLALGDVSYKGISGGRSSNGGAGVVMIMGGLHPLTRRTRKEGPSRVQTRSRWVLIWRGGKRERRRLLWYPGVSQVGAVFHYGLQLGTTRVCRRKKFVAPVCVYFLAIWGGMLTAATGTDAASGPSLQLLCSYGGVTQQQHMRALVVEWPGQPGYLAGQIKKKGSPPPPPPSGSHLQ